MKHRLVAVGRIGDQNCYLDVDRETALKRWEAQFRKEDSDISVNPIVFEFEFNDEFYAYHVWPLG